LSHGVCPCCAVLGAVEKADEAATERRGCCCRCEDERERARDEEACGGGDNDDPEAEEERPVILRTTTSPGGALLVASRVAAAALARPASSSIVGAYSIDPWAEMRAALLRRVTADSIEHELNSTRRDATRHSTSPPMTPPPLQVFPKRTELLSVFSSAFSHFVTESLRESPKRCDTSLKNLLFGIFFRRGLL
jgi:hypothetical protein